MKKTLVVWRRFGKEHSEDDGFRKNPEDVVSSSLQSKIEKFRKTESDDWRWWQVNEHLIVEKPIGTKYCGPDAVVYYLPRKNWVILENARFSGAEEWTWYVHIGKVEFSEKLKTWIFTDLFVDVLVQADNRTHTVTDLDDLGKAVGIGLISDAETKEILEDTQNLVDLICSGNFPPDELEDREGLLRQLHWA